MRKKMPAGIKGDTLKFWWANSLTDSAAEFREELILQGVVLAQITASEAAQSFEHEPVTSSHNYAIWAFREGEVVAIDSNREVLRLRESITGSDFRQMQRYLQELPKSAFVRSFDNDLAIFEAVTTTPPPPDTDGMEGHVLERRIEPERNFERERERTKRRGRDFGRDR